MLCCQGELASWTDRCGCFDSRLVFEHFDWHGRDWYGVWTVFWRLLFLKMFQVGALDNIPKTLPAIVLGTLTNPCLDSTWFHRTSWPFDVIWPS